MTEDRLKWTALIQRVTVVGAGESAERQLVNKAVGRLPWPA